MLFVFQLDGFSMFEKIYPSVDGTISGFVTLLAAAEVIGRATLSDEHWPIMFTLLQGVSVLPLPSQGQKIWVRSKNVKFKVKNIGWLKVWDV